MSVADIVSITVTSRFDKAREQTLPGEALVMVDGSVWFHPYSGGAPVCVIRSELQRRFN